MSEPQSGGQVILADIIVQDSTTDRRQQRYGLASEDGDVLANSTGFKKGKGQDELKRFLGDLRRQGWEVLREPNPSYGDEPYAYRLGRGTTAESRASLARSAPLPSPSVASPTVIVQQPKRRGCLSRLAIGIVVIVAILIAGGVIASLNRGDKGDTNNGAANATPDLGSGERPATLGTSVAGDGLEVTVYSATLSDTAGVLGAAEPGYLYLTIDASVKNVSKDKKSVNPMFFSAKDIVNGYTFDDDLMAGDPAAALGSTNDLAPGDILRGEVVIKVRSDSTQIRIKYDTSPIGGKNLYWLFTKSE